MLPEVAPKPSMTPVSRPFVILVIAFAALLSFAACGGDDSTAGKGQRITDPAKVPSSTPIQSATLYQIRGDQVSVAGGTPSTLVGGAGGTPAASRTYTVKSGDTCGAIAAQFNVSTDDLLKNNRTVDPGCTNLRAGDTLRIPPSTSGGGGVVSGPTSRPTGKSYTIVSGDTCDAIAKSYGVDVQRLIAVNGNLNCANLQIGQSVNIP